MSIPARTVQAAFLLAGAIALAAPIAGAQEPTRRPRQAIGREPEPVRHTVPYTPYPGASVTVYPHDGPGQGLHVRRLAPHPYPYPYPGPVVYVPVPVYGYYPAAEGAYTPQGSYGGSVTDVNGRPLSIGFDAGPSSSATPSYTPDLSGSPYVVIEDGLMLADMPNGERRTFPSCARAAARGPDGQPRTVFYQPAEYGLVLREGQRGRVHGAPASGARACYGLDSLGRIALLGA